MNDCPNCNGTGMIVSDADEDGYCSTICWSCAELDEDDDDTGTAAMNGADNASPVSNEKAFESGWRAAAKWAGREDLIADIGSPAYERDAAGVQPSEGGQHG
jgi:hypothetical protein